LQEEHVGNQVVVVDRRNFLRAATGTVAVALMGSSGRRAYAEAPPETRTLKIVQFPSGCQGPIHVAEDLLRGEGFTEVTYVKTDNTQTKVVEARAADVGLEFAAPYLTELDRGAEIVTLGGVHGGCFALFGNPNVRSVRDLKGKTVSVPAVDGQNSARVYIASMAAYVGLNPLKEITWVAHPVAESTQLFADGKVDAIMGFPPLAQELRAKKIGHVVVDSTIDRPWAQYFCCMIITAREFPKKYPVAAKRLVRAIVKANAICAQEPERVARLLMDKGVVKQYDYALQTVKELPYARWRDYDSEDTLRFYGLRLHEAGLIKTSPQKLIAQGSDLRFMNELRRELKG
jgi:NitT/TauT family transport system substrate-binding protein